MEGSKTVFVGNLSWTTNNEQLYEFLSQVGHVLSVEVKRYEDTNRSKGWGLVTYINHESALRAVALLDKKEINGRQVHMRLDRTVLDTTQDGTVGVYIGNLAWGVNENELLRCFAPFYPLNCHVLTNMYGRSRGFAILKFHDHLSAARAIDAMNFCEIAGRKIECRFDRGPPKAEDTDGKPAVFVSKIPSSITDESDLAALFHHCGAVASTKLQKAANGRPKGWGIVRFQTLDDAKRAVDTMNGIQLIGASAPLEVRFDRK